MKVGVKYCGGCNPEYRREDVEEMLRRHFTIFYSDDVDILVLINGCRRACLLDEVKRSNVISVDSPVSEGELLKKFKTR